MPLVATAFNGLDWLLVAIALVSLVRGVKRGAVSQVFSILGVGCGFILALTYYGPFSIRLLQVFPQLPKPGLVALLVLFLLAWFAFAVAGYWLSLFLHKQGLSFLDRVLGALVGLIKAAVVAMIIISVLVFFFSPKDSIIGRSALAPYLQKMAGVLVRAAPAKVQSEFDQKRKRFLMYWLGRQQACGSQSGSKTT